MDSEDFWQKKLGRPRRHPRKLVSRVKKRRRRPKKIVKDNVKPVEVEKKKRGRPRKTPIDTQPANEDTPIKKRRPRQKVSADTDDSSQPKEKRKPGRPRKSPINTDTETATPNKRQQRKLKKTKVFDIFSQNSFTSNNTAFASNVSTLESHAASYAKYYSPYHLMAMKEGTNFVKKLRPKYTSNMANTNKTAQLARQLAFTSKLIFMSISIVANYSGV
ncbi:hypothetical protein BDF19DRAFT_444803 [Syncephalis fuscata]|nr:hypothetical protein BDF19DRAFT_461432 [Syncephalis fuscata]KAI9594433.1 hypothetical protein BDF19DRAFT_444803 [Syncephalis fuscata]